MSIYASATTRPFTSPSTRKRRVHAQSPHVQLRAMFRGTRPQTGQCSCRPCSVMRSRSRRKPSACGPRPSAVVAHLHEHHNSWSATIHTWNRTALKCCGFVYRTLTSEDPLHSLLPLPPPLPHTQAFPSSYRTIIFTTTHAYPTPTQAPSLNDTKSPLRDTTPPETPPSSADYSSSYSS